MAHSPIPSSLRKWHLEVRNIDELIEHPRNARFMKKEDGRQLMQSICKFGLVDKPVITHDGMIIGGHQRIKILKEIGHAEVECLVCDDADPLTEQEIDELNIRLNKNVGNWDHDVLANEWDLDVLILCGFNPKDFFEDPEPKKKKPKVTMEFETKELLQDAMFEIEQIQNKYECKIKMKV